MYNQDPEGKHAVEKVLFCQFFYGTLSIQPYEEILGLLFLSMCSFSETDYFNIVKFEKKKNSKFISEWHFHVEWKKEKKGKIEDYGNRDQ